MYQNWIKDYERLKRKKCKCCEAIKELQEIENAQEKIQGVKHILKARLTSITRKKGIKREIGVINFDYYDLNYCPNVEITKVDLMRGRFKTIDDDFSEYDWEKEQSNIYIKEDKQCQTMNK